MIGERNWGRESGDRREGQGGRRKGEGRRRKREKNRNDGRQNLGKRELESGEEGEGKGKERRWRLDWCRRWKERGEDTEEKM